MIKLASSGYIKYVVFINLELLFNLFALSKIFSFIYKNTFYSATRPVTTNYGKYFVTVNLGKSLLIVNNSLSFEVEVLNSEPIAPCIVSVSTVKLACYTSKILLL